jgi:threonine synthase
LSLQRYLKESGSFKGFFVETAHPVKFYDVVEVLIGEKIPLPKSVEEIMDKEKTAIKMDVDYSFLKTFLLKL